MNPEAGFQHVAGENQYDGQPTQTIKLREMSECEGRLRRRRVICPAREL